MKYTLKDTSKLKDLEYKRVFNSYILNGTWTFTIVLKKLKGNCRIYIKPKKRKVQLEDLMTMAEILYEETNILEEKGVIINE